MIMVYLNSFSIERQPIFKHKFIKLIFWNLILNSFAAYLYLLIVIRIS